MDALQERYNQDCRVLNWTNAQVDEYWQEIAQQYGAANRHYHNLDHLRTLFKFFDDYCEQLRSPQVVTWSIWYHDLIYNAKRKDNEQQSALLAQKRLDGSGLPPDTVVQILEYIEATAHHLSVEAAGDLAYFLDFDLAILGTARTTYQLYAEAVRQEYRHVPGFFYRRGRKKVLRYFLEVDTLFRTPALRDRFEVQARENLKWELESL